MIQKQIAEWANSAFGPAPSVARVAARANEEMAELLRAATSDKHPATIVEEAADVVIVLYRLAEVCAIDLDSEIERKLNINRARKWSRDGTGHGYHHVPGSEKD